MCYGHTHDFLFMQGILVLIVEEFIRIFRHGFLVTWITSEFVSPVVARSARFNWKL